MMGVIGPSSLAFLKNLGGQDLLTTSHGSCQ